VKRRLGPATTLAEVQEVWSEVVGGAIAGEAAPVAEHAGVLTIQCSASVWAEELALLAPALLEQLNSRLTRGSITRLRCRTGPV
jgi:predicted nucleic acid-binding Zn ribbon protein